MSILDVSEFGLEVSGSQLLARVDLSIGAGESVALVGPSGSGKTSLLNAMAGFVPNLSRTTGTIEFEGRNLLDADESSLGNLRGKDIAVVAQDARGSLDPVWRVGSQMREAIRAHRKVSRREADELASAALKALGLNPDETMRAFPHRLSGGMCQRVALAMGLVHSPRLLLLDEPASMLDSASTDALVESIDTVRRQYGCAMVVVTHDMSIARRLCERMALMDGGRLREVEHFVSTTASAPKKVDVELSEATGNALLMRNVSASYGRRRVLDGLDLRVREGETLGLVGRSGCGKSTVLRAVLGSIRVSAGYVEVDRCNVTTARRDELQALRRRLGVVYQDPFAALDPRLTLGASIAEFATSGKPAKVSDDEIAEAMVASGLDPDLMRRSPGQLSGGQLQRACIARAIIRSPRLLLLDEPTSALDESVRRGLVETIGALAQSRAMSCVFVSHDLISVRSVADSIAVMDAGVVVESGPTESVLANPSHRATRELLRV